MTTKPLITGTDFITVATNDFDAAQESQHREQRGPRTTGRQ